MEEATLRQRRNLLSISLGLFLFMAGEGSIKTLFGVEFDRPWVAILFAWVGMGYFWWRYWIHGGQQAAREFENECRAYVTKNSKLIPYARRIIDANNPELIEHDAKIDFIVELSGGHKPRITFQIGPRASGIGMDIQSGCKIDVKQYFSLLTRNWIFSVVRGVSFSDYLLPHFFALFVTFIGLVKLILKFSIEE